MDIFKSKLLNRIAIWKSIGLVFWLSAFFIMPMFFTNADIFLRFALLFWYTTLWAIIWVFGVWVKYPGLGIWIRYWIRWAFIGAWMNFVLALFMYNELTLLMQGTFMEWCSPFLIILEWAIFWFIIDAVATKYMWDGKKLVK